MHTFYTDPGHGWLAVPLSELERLGIADKISTYSYMSGDVAYLEEDCDAPLFIKAAGITEFREVNTDNESIIRSYRRYVYPKTPRGNFVPADGLGY